MQNYGVPPLAIARGVGSRVWDVEGREYLDLIAGIAVSAIGHGHPALVRAVCDQVGTVAHTSNLFLHEGEVVLAERLLSLLGQDGRVFLCNSGAEANEAALKLVLKGTAGDAAGDAAGDGVRGRYVVATENGFHGRTMGALSLTGKASIRDPFGPFGTEVRFVPYGDAAALRSEVGDGCAALFVEPLQGEAGVVPAADGYLRAAREACDAAGTALVVDEIQSGIGRTGAWFAHQHEGVRPDVVTLAKGLGGGLPIGACIGVGRYGRVLAKGDHGTTFGGNPVAVAAALAVLDTIEREGLLGNAVKAGGVLSAGIAAVDHPLLAGVRGRGLWLAMTLTRPASAAVEAAAREAGFLVNAVQPDAIRIAPPLILTGEEARSFVDALPRILDTADTADTPAGSGTSGMSGAATGGTADAERSARGGR